MTTACPPYAQPRPEQAVIAEKMIADAITEIVAKLVAMAKDGNVPAAKYLVDRVLGRPAKTPSREAGAICQAADTVRPASSSGLLSKLEDLASLCFPDDTAASRGLDLNLVLKSSKGHRASTTYRPMPGIGVAAHQLG